MPEITGIEWPVLQIGSHTLSVRWTWYAKYLLSKRRVHVADLANLASNAAFHVFTEFFAAAVSENFREKSLPVPDADYWAEQISENGGDVKFEECRQAVVAAWAKTRPAQPAPAPQTTATTGTAPN